DTLEFAYCGPTAAANSMWWFDSQFADPAGTPGDGNDDYSLVIDNGPGDDHAAGNVPQLIEELATLFYTNQMGETNVSNMLVGLSQYLVARNQDQNYTVSNESWPLFEVVAQETEKCNVTILFLGFYDDEGNRVYGHIVTVSGVNTGAFQIGISDPVRNIANPIAAFTDYNDPLNVSHDMYDVMLGPPTPSLPKQTWWLYGYKSGYGFPMPPINFAVV
ncbi:unnamed protein product, partial [marine sediment metagenome]